MSAPLQSTTSSPEVWKISVPYQKGCFLPQYFLSLSVHFLMRKVEIRGHIHLSDAEGAEMFLGVEYHMHLLALLSTAKAEASIAFAIATTPRTSVKLHLTSFPLMIFSRICPSHGQKTCSSHSEFCLHEQKLKAKPAKPL